MSSRRIITEFTLITEGERNDRLTEVLDVVRTAGAEVASADEENGILEGWIQSMDLPRLKRLPGVQRIIEGATCIASQCPAKATGRSRKDAVVIASGANREAEPPDVRQVRQIWDIYSTTELLKEISTVAKPGELLRLFIDHVRLSVPVRRAMILNNAGLTRRQYRIVRTVAWDDEGRAGAVTESGKVREGGLLGEILSIGLFQNINELSPEASDPAFGLLCGSRSLMAFPFYEQGASTGMIVILASSPHACNTDDLCGLAMMSSLLDRAAHAQALAAQLEATRGDLNSELRVAADMQRCLLTSRAGLKDGAQ